MRVCSMDFQLYFTGRHNFTEKALATKRSPEHFARYGGTSIIYLSKNIVIMLYVCMYVCMHAFMHACMYACMHTCMYARMYLCM